MLELADGGNERGADRHVVERYRSDGTGFRRIDEAQHHERAVPTHHRKDLAERADLADGIDADAVVGDLRAGLRYDEDGFSSEGYVSPRLAFNYRLGPDTRLSASAGLFYQSPRYFDLAADPSNRDLANERIAHLSAGFTHRINDRWDLLVEAYAQKLDDLVTEDVRTSRTLSNDGEGTNLGIDVVLVDTAGRLHTNRNLMEELKKVDRVIAKRLEGAPHETLIVLDATIGQNAVNQVRQFHKAVGVSHEAAGAKTGDLLQR